MSDLTTTTTEEILVPDFNLDLATLNKFNTDFEIKIANVSKKWKAGYLPATEEELLEMKTDYKIIKEEIKFVDDKVAEFLAQIVDYERELKTKVAYWKNLAKTNVLDKLTLISLTLRDTINNSRKALDIKELERIAAEKKIIEEANAAKVAQAKELLESLGMDSSGVEEQVANISAVQVANIVKAPAPKSVYTSAGIVTDRTSYKILSMDKIAIMKWLLEHPDHMELFTVNQVYANQVFKPTKAKPNPMKVEGLVFEQVTTV